MNQTDPHGEVVGFIFARGGSKGVPRKNLRWLAGKPLLAHAIETALGSRWIRRVVVSTEDDEIAQVARDHGAMVPFMRPAELATDDCPEWKAWQHAIREVNNHPALPRVGVFVSVPTTAPLRAASDVDRCIDMFLTHRPDIVVTVSDAHRNPFFNMLVVDGDGSARPVISRPKAARRQDSPSVFDMTTVAYVARPEFVLGAESLFDGDMKAVVVPRERALDIDTELDFQIAESLLARSDSHLSRQSKAG